MPTAKQGKGFNSAVSGQEANHMGEQAQLLVDRLRADKNVDFENDWKVITLFIGGNDLCDYCKDKDLHSSKQYLNDIIEALDILYNNVPKTFVNLVTVLRATEVKHLNLYLVCNVLHKMTCPCAGKNQ
jgi:phospholipase B1